MIWAWPKLRHRVASTAVPTEPAGGPPSHNATNAFGENPVLKLMFGATIRASERWRAIRITDFERRQMQAVRQELDHEYEARSGLVPQPSADAHQTKLSSSSRA